MPKWTQIATIEKQNLTVDAPWIAVVEDFGDVTHLQLKGEGSWLAMGPLFPSCGADGIAGLALKDDRLVLTDCPAGALIGRIGGSSASNLVPTSTDNESKPFAIGAQCTIALPNRGAFGALFVSFNSVVRPVQVATLKLIVTGVKLPPPPTQ